MGMQIRWHRMHVLRELSKLKSCAYLSDRELRQPLKSGGSTDAVSDDHDSNRFNS